MNGPWSDTGRRSTPEEVIGPKYFPTIPHCLLQDVIIDGLRDLGLVVWSKTSL